METKGDTAFSNENTEQNVKQYKLEKEQELRFEVDGKEKVQFELVSGLAELFGTELIKGKKYEFAGGTKAAIFTWYGCVLDLTGSCSSIYIGEDTPMTYYANVHGALETIRNKAKDNDSRGPIVLVVGPTDTGKATLSRILCNYAVRRSKCPVFIDLNVACNSIGIPGSIGINLMERPSDIEEKSSPTAPLLFHFGFTSPGENSNFYNALITRVSQVVQMKADHDKSVKYSGAIINTCSWVTESGYDTLLHIAKSFEVDVILVLDMPKLCNDLTRDLPSSVKIIPTPKSNGVVRRTPTYRDEMREERIRKYFYGAYKSAGSPKFSPYSFTIPFSQLKIFKVGSLSIPASCLPIGMKPKDDQTKMVPMAPSPALHGHILSVSFATSSSEAVEANIMGFICVNGVKQDDPKKPSIRVLSPQPGPLPSGSILLYSEVQFTDSD